MLRGLEVIQLKTITYRNIQLQEMDIDQVLERRPSLVLVDELAHTECTRLPACEALSGRRRATIGRDECLHNPKYPAFGKPE